MSKEKLIKFLEHRIAFYSYEREAMSKSDFASFLIRLKEELEGEVKS